MQDERSIYHFFVAREPAESPTRHAHRLRQSANHDRAIVKRRQRFGTLNRVIKVAINLVAYHERVVISQSAGDASKIVARNRASGGIRRADANDDFGLRRQRTTKLIDVKP